MREISLITLSTLLAGCLTAQTPDNDTIISSNVALKDGSTIKGEFYTQRITGSTAFLKELELNPAIVKSLSFSGTNGEAKVELTNGDKFAMTVANENFKIKSLLGELDIPRASFRSLALSARRGASAAERGLVFYCTFDDEAALASPAVGPSVKLELGQIEKNEGKVGGALFVNPGIAGAQIVFPAETLGNEGCIEFWANMASGKTEFSTGGDPRFFILSDRNGTEFAHFEFASNNGCGNSGLGGHFCGGLRTQTHAGFSHLMPYSDIFKGEDFNGWHHYAFVWTQSQIIVYLDGKQICSASGDVDTSTFVNSDVIMDIPLNRERGKSFNNKSAFLMDELKIWNYAKTDFSL